jgi:phospholipid transport system substrate-binding protein
MIYASIVKAITSVRKHSGGSALIVFLIAAIVVSSAISLIIYFGEPGKWSASDAKSRRKQDNDSYRVNHLESIKGPIEKIITTIKDSNLNSPERLTIPQKEIWDLIKQLFDFEELAKRCLSHNWKKFDDQAQENFVRHFSTYFANFYMLKVIENFEVNRFFIEKVIISNSKKISEFKEIVYTNLVYSKIREGKEDTKETKKTMVLPINYRTIQKQGQCKVYDIIFEGISLIQQHRLKFNFIIVNNKVTPAELIEYLKLEIEKQNEKGAFLPVD